MTVVHRDDRRAQRPVFVSRVAFGSHAPPHAVAHGYVVLTLCTDGQAQLEQRGLVSFAAGDVHLIPAGEPHRLLTAARADGWGLGFDAVALTSTGLADLLEPFERVRAGAAPVVRIPAGRQEHLRGVLAELQRESERPPGPVQAQVQRSLLVLALAEVTRAADWTAAAHGSTTGSAAAPPLVAEALRFIERNCLAPISLRDVAAALGRSPAYLTTAMRLATGRTTQQWISAGRLAETRRRLLIGDESVEAIAAQVGYLEPSSLIRAFRREHGESPAAWRTAQRRGA